MTVVHADAVSITIQTSHLHQHSPYTNFESTVKRDKEVPQSHQLPHRAMSPRGMTGWPPSWLLCGSAPGCTAQGAGTPANCYITCHATEITNAVVARHVD
jgi:hypothetical protein